LSAVDVSRTPTWPRLTRPKPKLSYSDENVKTTGLAKIRSSVALGVFVFGAIGKSGFALKTSSSLIYSIIQYVPGFAAVCGRLGVAASFSAVTRCPV